jgi:PAS domain S-box-containing protein
VGTLIAERGESRRASGLGALPYPVQIALLAVVYYVAAKLSLRLSLIGENVTPLWPPTGIAVAALFVFGSRLWPGVAIGAFLVNLPISANAGWALLTAAGNTLAPVVAVSLLRLGGFRRQIDRWRDALAIVFLAGLEAMLLSAAIGAGTLVLSGDIASSKFVSAFSVWWTGDAMGVLVVAPFLFVLPELVRWDVPISRRIEWVVTLVVIALVAVAVTSSSVRMLSVIIPLLVWTAWRFELRGAAPAALIVAGIASWAAAHHWAPFAHGSLLARMASLQAFNASVAFSSLVFAALVSERSRAKDELQHAADELEARVHDRTRDLSRVNDQLADAQRIARLGSWEWDIPADGVYWSDEMFRIYGYEPQEFRVTFDRALERVVPEDRERIRTNVANAFESGQGREIPVSEFRIELPDGEQRTLHGRSRLEFGEDGTPLRMVGTVQDFTDQKRAQREHRIAETLQRSLLPERLPQIPGVLLAARYVPATEDMEVGGDWYDVVPLPNGNIGLAVGDVAGHGLRAATIMGQLRMALRAYALEETTPSAVVGGLHHLSHRLDDPEMATVIYAVYDPETSELRFASAGHLPPLVIDPQGRATYLDAEVGPPLGAVVYPDASVESRFELPAGSTLMLFTDGLVERRGASINEGLSALQERAGANGHDLEALCDELLSQMVGDQVSDDVAILALRPLSLAGADVVRLEVPADPHVLAHLRQTLRRWLREVGAGSSIVTDLLIATGEAWANAIQHAYGADQGTIEVQFRPVDDAVEVVTRDRGRWRPESLGEGGHGLDLMRGFADSVDIDTGPDGTVVTLRKKLGRS